MQRRTVNGSDARGAWRRLLWGVIPALFFAATALAADSATVPKQEGWVTDQARVLSPAARTRLANTLSHFEDETQHQMSILVMRNLGTESIEMFSARVFKDWHLGRGGVDDGVLVVLALQERKVRIEVGKDMQRYLSDATTQSIVDDFMTPEFAKGNFAGGLDEGAKWLMQEARRFKRSPPTSGLESVRLLELSDTEAFGVVLLRAADRHGRRNEV